MIPSQMNGGVYNVPQQFPMTQAGFMPQYQPRVTNNQANGEMTGLSRSLGNQGQQPGGYGGQAEQPPPVPSPFEPSQNQLTAALMGAQQGQQRQSAPMGLPGPQMFGAPAQEEQSPFEPNQNQQGPAVMGGFPGQSSAMGGAGRSMGYGVSMDLSGKMSLVNPMNSGYMPAQPRGPLNQNPFQETHPEARDNMELMNKEKQMLDPNSMSQVNDLSDPLQESQQQSKMNGVTPDTLLEMARFRSNDAAQQGQAEMPAGNPENLLDNLHMGQLDLAGPGDPEKIGR